MLLQLWKRVYPCFMVLKAHKTVYTGKTKIYLPKDMSIESLTIWLVQLKIEAEQIHIY